MKIVAFTGAGISKESGIDTFRDADGLWNNYKIEDVATPRAWKKNRELVLDFYNQRRKHLNEVEPNEAHIILRELEEMHKVVIITQNVDDLHERAGSSNILHLHGELKKSRSTLDHTLIYDCEGDILIGDRCEKNSQLRPHIVWFGENLNPYIYNDALSHIRNADICIIIGTSLQVEPAASMPKYVKCGCKIYYIDPSTTDRFNNFTDVEFTHIQKIATEGMRDIKELFL